MLILTGIALPWVGWASLSIIDLYKQVAIYARGYDATIKTNKLMCEYILGQDATIEEKRKFCVGDWHEGAIIDHSPYIHFIGFIWLYGLDKVFRGQLIGEGVYVKDTLLGAGANNSQLSRIKD